LLVKLDNFDEEVEARQRAARRYDDALADVVKTPRLSAGCSSSYAQYTIRLEDSARRDSLAQHLGGVGVPTAVHYPQPLDTQPSLAPYLARRHATPVVDRLCDTVLSLPLSAYIAEADQERVIKGVLSWSKLQSATAGKA
jgi:dTDP-4-amino-4,6-dideoxygalactose transaminase